MGGMEPGMSQTWVGWNPVRARRGWDGTQYKPGVGGRYEAPGVIGIRVFSRHNQYKNLLKRERKTVAMLDYIEMVVSMVIDLSECKEASSMC